LSPGEFNLAQHGFWGLGKTGGFGVSFCEYQFKFGADKEKLLEFLTKRREYLLEQVVQVNKFIIEVRTK